MVSVLVHIFSLALIFSRQTLAQIPAVRPCGVTSALLSRPLRALRPPGWLPQWHCGVRVSSNKKLVGFISAIPADIRIYDT